MKPHYLGDPGGRGGFSSINALTTYISHGDDKSKAINMFIDKHILQTDETMIKFLKNFGNQAKLKK